MKDLAVLRVRKDVPGVGRKIARIFNAQEVVCSYFPTVPLAYGTVVFNYGRSTLPIWFTNAEAKNGVTILNHPEAVANSVDKRKCLSLMEEAGVPALEMTEEKETAAYWITDGFQVIVRHVVNGKQGKGVELVSERTKNWDDAMNILPDAPMYTKFYDKTEEFRVHVFQGKVIAIIQKKMMGAKKRQQRGLTEVDMLTRNHKKGWIFAINDLICDQGGDNGRTEIEQIGIAATNAVGLDYCGVDILARYDKNGVYIDAVLCETNSAPGMSGLSTVKAYTEAIQEVLAA